MITLDPALDKLRNKELSFGCKVEAVFEGSSHDENINTKLFLTYGKENETKVIEEVLSNDDKNYIRNLLSCKVLGHPLTWGRLCHLGYPKLWNNKVHSREDTRCEEMGKLLINIEDLLLDMQSFDQNELQRMTSPKRPELRELLIKFAEYI